jgi:acyl-CoA synthetase (AMP-forming)/AMP-acid ligase II
VNPAGTEDEIARQLRQAGARWLVATAALAEQKLRVVIAESAIVETFVTGERAAGGSPLRSLRATAHAPIAAVSASDVALLPSSSGTTGWPKSVELTHRNLVASLCQTRLVHQVTEDDVVIAALPLFHIYGLQITLNLPLLAGATVVILIAPDAGPDRADSVGPALPGVECRIVDPGTGADLRPGEPGELLVRTAGVMRGYLGNPEATAATIDRDGWVHTGDIVTADEDAWFYVTDRVKELIKYKGFQVAPAELEAILLTHPAVADAAVVRGRDGLAGEVPKAFVVLQAPASAQELMAWVAERVASYKRVRQIEFTDSIPKSPSGKILRRLLVEQEATGSTRSSVTTCIRCGSEQGTDGSHRYCR